MLFCVVFKFLEGAYDISTVTTTHKLTDGLILLVAAMR